MLGSGFVPANLPPPLDRDRLVGKVHELLEDTKTSLLRLEAKAEALPDPNVLLLAMRTREAQASSEIENTVASVDEVALAELGGEHSSAEAREVVNNRLAIEHGLNSKLPISIRLIRGMHGVLMRGVRGEFNRAGQLRDRQVYIGDKSRGFARARFVPPPPGEHLQRSLAAWEAFVNVPSSATPSLPYLMNLALAHYQFEGE